MANATIERGSTSVTLPLVDSQSGTPVFVRSIGKPQLQIQETGSIQPRHIDVWSGNLQYTLLGRLTDSSAYTKAITLADLIKENGNGTPLTLNANISEVDTDIQAVPAAGQDQSLQLVYPPGRRNEVQVDLGLTRVSRSEGYDQPANTPTASGTGPIQITDGSTTVDLTADVEVTRNVGRPNSVVRRSPEEYPWHVDTHKTAADTFELSLQFVDNAITKVNNVAELFSQKLGRSSLDLKFNGLYGMGTLSVVPEGSEAIRLVRPSGEQGTNVIPTINLRRVIS